MPYDALCMAGMHGGLHGVGVIGQRPVASSMGSTAHDAVQRWGTWGDASMELWCARGMVLQGCFPEEQR